MRQPTERITVEEFQARLKAQGVPRQHLAFKCVMCGTVQSMASLIKAGAGKTEEQVEKYIGFSCVGRFTGAGSHVKDTPPGKGCDWTLGGLLQFHELAIITPDGQVHKHFAIASPEEAQALMRINEVAAKREDLLAAPAPENAQQEVPAGEAVPL